jgi:3-hexulose-6-phosphate synthase/6-phospho-3-hexuloisomerase
MNPMQRGKPSINMFNRPYLQFAVDAESIEEFVTVIETVYPHFDILEIGTPLIIAEGLRAVEIFKTRWPDKICLADTKIMDAGGKEAGIAFDKGADIVTVLGCADDVTIAEVVKTARKYNKRVMVDLINCRNLSCRVKQLKTLDVDILCVHAATDSKKDIPGLFSELKAVRKLVKCPLAIAGGISENTILDAVSAGASIVIVGSAISRAEHTAETASFMMKVLQEAKVPVVTGAGTPVLTPGEIINSLIEEIGLCINRIDINAVLSLLDEIDNADNVFVAAMGRSGISIKGFAMRLMHMGLKVHVVGDATAPAISPGDLLLIGSGSGSTDSLVTMAMKAKSLKTRIALITIDSDSPVGKIADTVVSIPAPSPKVKKYIDVVESMQPMGSLFEQSLSILLDAVVIMLMQRHKLNANDMFRRHANLE